MKITFIVTAASIALLATARAEDTKTPPPLVMLPPPAASPQTYIYDQKPLAGMPALIPPQQAESIVDQFKAGYAKLGSPRILIYVNRELVDEHSGVQLGSRTEKIDSSSTVSTSSASGSTNAPDKKENEATHTSIQNHYSNNGKNEPILADRQTVRDVERLMGRPLRSSGAVLVDQRVASQFIANRSLDSITTETEQARKDREAVGKIADVVVEVLISSRNVTVPEISGDRNYVVPDIQMTAIQLKDSKVIGQAAAADVMSKAGSPGYVARNFGVQAVTEATTLALMDDMLQEAK